jgi:hypothetical protein
MAISVPTTVRRFAFKLMDVGARHSQTKLQNFRELRAALDVPANCIIPELVFYLLSSPLLTITAQPNSIILSNLSTFEQIHVFVYDPVVNLNTLYKRGSIFQGSQHNQ